MKIRLSDTRNTSNISLSNIDALEKHIVGRIRAIQIDLDKLHISPSICSLYLGPLKGPPKAVEIKKSYFMGKSIKFCIQEIFDHEN